jgi:hypothetical protein
MRIGGVLVVVLAAALALALALAPGCGKRKLKKPTPPPPAAVEVITDPAAVAAARKAWADAREEAVASLLANPGTIRSYEDESITLLQAQRERSVSALERIRDDAAQPAERRVEAIVALKAIGVAPDAGQLAPLASDPQALLRVLWNLRELYPPKGGLPPEVRQVVVGAVSSADERVRSTAAGLVTPYQITEAADAVVKQVLADPKADAAYLQAAAKLRPSGEVLDALVARLKGSNEFEAHFVVSAVADLARASGDGAVRRRAADACFEYVKQRRDEASIDTGMLSAIETIATAVPPEAAKPMLADLVRTARHRYVRTYALADLKKLDPSLAASVSSETRVALEPEPPPTKGKKLTPQEAAAVAVRHKLLTQAEADAALAALARPATRPSSEEGEEERSDEGSDGVRALLRAARRHAEFDVETGVVPNRHDQLILELAPATAGRFKPEAVLETYTPDGPDADTGKYAVQFIHGGRLYRFNPRDLGDWYDLDAVLTALNRAFEDARLSDRFTPLAAGGQVAELVFADPSALTAAAPELGLLVSTDPDDARKQGKAYEDQFIGQLKGN